MPKCIHEAHRCAENPDPYIATIDAALEEHRAHMAAITEAVSKTLVGELCAENGKAANGGATYRILGYSQKPHYLLKNLETGSTVYVEENHLLHEFELLKPEPILKKRPSGQPEAE